MRKNYNRLAALGLTAATVLSVGRAALHDKKPAEPKITFESNAQAQYRLQDLARVYGSGEVSKAEKHDINAAVEGAIPVFKQTVAEDAKRLMDLSPEGRGRNVKVNEKGRQVTYSIYSNYELGSPIKRITIERGTAQGSGTTESLDVESTEAGISVSYSRGEGWNSTVDSDPSVAGVQPDKTEHYLSIGADDSLYARSSHSARVERYGMLDSQFRFVGGRFNNHGLGVDYQGLGAGSGVETVAAEMQNIGDMVTAAVAALSAPVQPAK